VVRADDVAGRIKADGAWTETPGVVCAVLTADCLPVLFCTQDGTRVAAAHAGWRGLCAGVLELTTDNFLQAGFAPDNILVWLGPAIGPVAYEVDAAVRDAFLVRGAALENCFAATRPGHWNFDLCAAARLILAGRGISHVSGGDMCTFNDQRFYSHRRDPGCGRQATLIWRTR
jgi:YfiH family protein